MIELVDWLHTFCGDHPEQMAVAIEVPHGARGTRVQGRGTGGNSGRAALRRLLDQPKQLNRFRDRNSPAGAKDDERDAMVLGDSLRTDPHCFRLVRLALADILRLRELSRLEESLG